MTFQEFRQYADNFTGSNEFYSMALYAQACLESDYFRSNIYINSYNAFGMRVPAVREHVNIGVYHSEGNGDFSQYSSLQQSIEDRVLWDKDRKFSAPTSLNSIRDYYLRVVATGYGGKNHEEYFKRLVSFFNNIFGASHGSLNPLFNVGFSSSGSGSSVTDTDTDSGSSNSFVRTLFKYWYFAIPLAIFVFKKMRKK